MQLKRLKSANELVNCIIEKQLINPESRDKTNKFSAGKFVAMYQAFMQGIINLQ